MIKTSKTVKKYLAEGLLFSIVFTSCGSKKVLEEKVTDISFKEKTELFHLEEATTDKGQTEIIRSNKEEISKMNLTNKQQRALEQTLERIDIPEGYKFLSVREEIQNGEKIFLYRYVKSENNILGGEHFSFVVRQEDSLILGVTWMDKIFEQGTTLPNKEEAETYVKEYLSVVEPALFDKLDNLWIDEHNEIITVNEKEMIVTGIKYKCYLPDEKTYAWIVLGKDRAVITFERGIVWNNAMSKRVSEMWLHDRWLENK